jgi:hypothetical protein
VVRNKFLAELFAAHVSFGTFLAPRKVQIVKRKPLILSEAF